MSKQPTKAPSPQNSLSGSTQPAPKRGESTPPKNSRTGAPSPARQARGNETRLKLLTAAIDVFGRKGFEGATTRELTLAADANLQAIPYHFRDKAGLYLACAQHIGQQISKHMDKPRRKAEAALKTKLSDVQARLQLRALLEAWAEIFVSPESAPWARFMIREQIEPTEAFWRVYNGFLKPVLTAASQLAGILLNLPADDETVRLRTLSLLGGIIILRVGNAASMAFLEWREIGPAQLTLVRQLVVDMVNSLRPRGEAL